MNTSYRTARNESLGAGAALSRISRSRAAGIGRRGLTLTAVMLAVAGFAGGAAAQAVGGGVITNPSGTAVSPTLANCQTGLPGADAALTAPASAADGSIAIGCGALAAQQTTGLPVYSGNVAIGLQARAVGGTGSTTNFFMTAVGTLASTQGINSTALGANAQASADYAVAINSKALGQGAVAIGSSIAVAENSIAIGFTSSTTTAATGGIAFGAQAVTSAADGVALGRGARAAHADAVALGSASATGASATVTDATVMSLGGGTYSYGGFAGNGNVVGVVSVGNAATGETRQLTNLAPGAITATSTDGVNGSQLYAVSRGLNDRIDTIGNATPGGAGGASVVPGAPVANSAIATNSTAYVAPSATGQDATAIGSGAMATGGNSVSLGTNSFDDGRTNVVSVGSAGNERQITNVAPGVQGTDAVNVNQLNATGSRISAVAEQLNRDTKMLSGGIAASAALAVVTPVEPGRYHVSGAVAGYNGQAGVGFNVLKRSNDGQTTLHAGVGWGSGGSKAIVRVGFGLSFD